MACVKIPLHPPSKAIIYTTKLYLNALTCYNFNRGSLCAQIPRILMEL